MTQRLPHLGFIGIIIIALLIYLPGLQGPFLFDDYANLSKLGDFNGVRNIETFKRFVFGGFAGPTGRPIALLSFLANDTNWPANTPYPFKLTNVLLHLLTGAFLFGVIYQLASIRSDQFQAGRAKWFAAAAAASWVLHPFFVSTTLYVVQRMAILAALFAAIGLLSYIHGRRLLEGHPAKAYGWMTFSVTGCTLLALFSKENGALLPVLLLALEWSVLQDKKSKLAPLNRAWKGIFLWLPLGLLIAYIASGLVSGKISGGYGGRHFTLPERVLTEGRIMFDYLYHLLIPQMYSRGLFTKNFPVSSDLFNPLSTFVAIIGIFTLLGVAWYFRKRIPFLTLAIVFFFAGHILESTVFPLELYFEHRNYLPSFFLFLPLVQAFVSYPSKKFTVILMVSAWLVLLGVFTWQRTLLWGNPNELALLWARDNPLSQRAQVTAANTLMQSGNPRLAIKVLERATETMPDDLVLKLHLLGFQCLVSEVSQTGLDSAHQAFATIPYDPKAFEILKKLVEISLTGECRGISSAQIISILKTLSDNPSARNNRTAQGQLDHLLGAAYAHQQRREEAFERFNQALQDNPSIELGLVQTAILATNRFYQEAVMHLDMTQDIQNRLAQEGTGFDWKNHLPFSRLYQDDINYLREQIEEDMNPSQRESDYGIARQPISVR